MPKNKTHKGLAKRIKVTGTGKVKHRKSGKSHLNSHFTGSQNRTHRKAHFVAKSIAKRLERVLHRRLRGADQSRPEPAKTEQA